MSAHSAISETPESVNSYVFVQLNSYKKADLNYTRVELGTIKNQNPYKIFVRQHEIMYFALLY